jgi:hypothetical protein
MKEENSLDGIIASLTTKHGNVHEKGIVTITSRSVLGDDSKYALQNVAVMKPSSGFTSAGEPFQWICWDFHEMRVRPTGYSLCVQWLQSWVLEGAADGDRNWTEIDRQTDKDQDFKNNACRVTFAISTSREFRWIRLTQTGTNHSDPTRFRNTFADGMRNSLHVRSNSSGHFPNKSSFHFVVLSERSFLLRTDRYHGPWVTTWT